MGEDDRRPRRRPQDAGRARRATGDRVEERALAGAGRTEQEHDQGRIEARRADPDVPAEMVPQPRGARPGRIGRRAQRPAPARKTLEPVDEFAQPYGRSRGLRLGMVIHRQRVAPERGRGVVGTVPRCFGSVAVRPRPVRGVI